ncbi:Acyltransferase [Rubripirellula lacrimiformis]|uniref:Acyltransferase n=1 Tax=Rubripirellula lacrimiformis TaxID=1930273 RepID=A0A517N6B9_9BACT|nr:1-acyl-sn-glycerol-3-phosphate acyltransferase [Rubripirellula lacrimiformis]QDT02677.1 Acyltransferase [Rubripirellula lacrimiformis]
MTVVLDRPYQFVPPHRGNAWPSFIQTFRIVDLYLARKEGVVQHECRGLDHWRASKQRGDGILLAPNHCRYADPLVIGWPARQLGSHVFAMASWHLFNVGAFDSFAIRKMGGFSINREGSDRASLEMAIEVLAAAERPLILFPEGTTNRTNDVLKPLLEGVAFIARAAARRRDKECGGQLVMHPIAIKYLCVGKINDWAQTQLSQLETHLGWRRPVGASILDRTIRLAEGLLALKEIEYFGTSQTGDLRTRRDRLILHILQQSELRLGLFPAADTHADGARLGDSVSSDSVKGHLASAGPSGLTVESFATRAEFDSDIRSRVRVIRTETVTQYFRCIGEGAADQLQERYQRESRAANLAQDLMSYPDCYLDADQVTDTRIVETIQRMQETFFGRADVRVPLKAVIQCDEAIVVPPQRAPRGQTDPIMDQLGSRLTSLVDALSHEARSAKDAGLI